MLFRSSINCSCPRANANLISASTPPHAVGYATNTTAGRRACACQADYGATPAGCPSLCVPCTPEETSFYCGSSTGLPTVPTNANNPWAIQNASLCVSCPFKSMPGARAVSCPGEIRLRQCNSTEVINYCGTGHTSCILSCDTDRPRPEVRSRCRLWGRCGGPRACTATEARRLCSRYDPTGLRASGAVRYGYYTGADPNLAIPEGAEHALTSQSVTGCTALENQIDVGLRVEATACTYNCTFFDRQFSLCTAVDLSTQGQCTDDTRAAMCGFADQEIGRASCRERVSSPV